MPSVGYAFYRDEYRGRLSEDEYGRALPRAESEVRRRAWPRGESDAPEAWARAVCAACDVEAAHGFSGGAGEGGGVSLGSFSVSPAADGAGRYARDMADAVGREVAGTPLQFSGMG